MTSGPALAGAAILQRTAQLTEWFAASLQADHPVLAQRLQALGPGLPLADAELHFRSLAQALALDSRAVLLDYLAWARAVLAQRGIPASDLQTCLHTTMASLQAQLRPDEAAVAVAVVADGVLALPAMADEPPSFMLEDHGALALLAHQYLHALLRAERGVASRLVLDAAAQGVAVRDLYLQVFQPCQYEIGRLWQINRISVAQEHYCTAATQLIMSQLYPWLFQGDRVGRRLVATCAAGDLHELGGRMLADFFEMAGWDTFYTGASTPVDDVLQLLAERRADLLAVSATLTRNVPAVAGLIARVRQQPGAAELPILVGGYPFRLDAALWREVGADGCAADADAAIALADRLVAGRQARPQP